MKFYIYIACGYIEKSLYRIYVGSSIARALKPLPLDPLDKLRCHIDALFGSGISEVVDANATFVFSRKTGRLKHFYLEGKLCGTFRTDGGIALTIAGAERFIHSSQFLENCVTANTEAIPFVSEGRSLFCKHVEHCGKNVNAGSDVAIITDQNAILAVGVSIHNADSMTTYRRGVAVRVRQSLKSREAIIADKD